MSLPRAFFKTVFAACLLTACGGSPAAAPGANTPSAVAASTKSSPTGGSFASPAGSYAASASATSAGATSAGASSAAGGAAISPSAAVKLTIAPDSSQADITVREILAGNTIKTDAVESTKAVSGTIVLDASGAVAPGSSWALDLRTLKSDRGTRDNFIKGRFVLNTGQMPNAEFLPKSVQGLDGSMPASGQKTFKLLGDATVHGVTKPLTWDVTATFEAQKVSGQATTDFKLSDFEISIPKLPSVVEVEDQAKLNVKFEVARSAA
jgi:polyisoprenoid-binding protein YceI